MIPVSHWFDAKSPLAHYDTLRPHNITKPRKDKKRNLVYFRPKRGKLQKLLADRKVVDNRHLSGLKVAFRWSKISILRFHLNLQSISIRNLENWINFWPSWPGKGRKSPFSTKVRQKHFRNFSGVGIKISS